MLTENTRRSPLLATEAYRFALRRALSLSESKCLLVSAYVTKIGTDWLRRAISKPNVRVHIVARWTPRDILTGASDTASYWLARERGWDFRIHTELHAKFALVDDTTLFVGSANFTGHGLSLTPGANREFGISAEASKADIASAWALQRAATPLSDDLVSDIESWAKTQPRAADVSEPESWPKNIFQRTRPMREAIWVADFPWAQVDMLFVPASTQSSSTAADDVLHDTQLFPFQDIDDLKHAFLESTCFRWLCTYLQACENKQVWFGQLSADLQSALSDDPTPYRKDVKILLSNLLTYCELLAFDTVGIDQPNYSQRVFLRS